MVVAIVNYHPSFYGHCCCVIFDVHARIVRGGFEFGSASIAPASASPKHPSSMVDAPNALMICVWPLVSAAGATCLVLPGIVDDTWAACNAGGSEKKGIF